MPSLHVGKHVVESPCLLGLYKQIITLSNVEFDALIRIYSDTYSIKC